MIEEYLLLVVALRPVGIVDRAPAAANRIVLAAGEADAAAQGQLWAYEVLPPQFGWEDHTIRAERLNALRPATINEGARP